MTSKQPSIWLAGQRSISSSFLFRPSNRDSKENGPTKDTCKDSRVSLSDFLNRKLQKSSDQVKTVQGKKRQFSSPVGFKDVNVSDEGRNGVKEGNGNEKNLAIEKLVFEQFKQVRKEKKDFDVRDRVDEAGSATVGADRLESKKRRNPFEADDEKCNPQKHLVVLGDDPKQEGRFSEDGLGKNKKPKPLHNCCGNETYTAPKHFVVLGDDPKPKQRYWEDRHAWNKKPKSLYNHYANGGGWWDSNMEGVDNEAVGCSEAWEGMGSITLGGLDWH